MSVTIKDVAKEANFCKVIGLIKTDQTFTNEWLVCLMC